MATPPPLIPALPPVTRYNKKTVMLVVMLGILGAGGLWFLHSGRKTQEAGPRTQTFAEEAATTALPMLDSAPKVTTYDKLPIIKAPGLPQALPVSTTEILDPLPELPPLPSQPPALTPAPGQGVPAASQNGRPATGATSTRTTTKGNQGATTQPSGMTTQPKDPDADNWLFADLRTPKQNWREGSSARGTRGSGDGQADRGEREGQGPPPGLQRTSSRQRQPSQLFPPAVWERPANPLRVIYQSQLMKGVLVHDVQSGEHSYVQVELNETLFDKFGQQEVLLPQGTKVIGLAEGSIRRGQRKMRVAVKKVEAPDGTDILFPGKLGDAGGAVGVKGKVDNKYLETGLVVILTAAASIGTRSITGNPRDFQPSLGQEFTADVAQSLNQSGNRLIQQQFNVEPEITLFAKTPVTIQLDQNLSLQTEPVIIHR